MDSSFVRPEAVLARRVGDEVMLLDTASEKYFSLNKVGAEFYEMITSGHSIEAAVDSLAGDYDAPRDTIAADMEAIVRELRDRGLLQAA